jgi:hypothetical protein
VDTQDVLGALGYTLAQAEDMVEKGAWIEDTVSMSDGYHWYLFGTWTSPYANGVSRTGGYWVARQRLGTADREVEAFYGGDGDHLVDILHDWGDWDEVFCKSVQVFMTGGVRQ